MAAYIGSSLSSHTQLRSTTSISLTAQSGTRFYGIIKLRRKAQQLSIRVSIEDDNNDKRSSSLTELASRDSRTHPSNIHIFRQFNLLVFMKLFVDI